MKKCNKTNQTSGPFDLTIILGVNSSINEHIESPAIQPTYFCPKKIQNSIPKNLEESNLIQLEYVNNFKILLTDREVKVGMIPDLLENENDNIEKAFANVDHLDILITYQQPSSVDNNIFVGQNNKLIDDIIIKTQPKYVFCSSKPDLGKYIELKPFQWKDSRQITRICCLAEFKNNEREIWFYAFKLSDKPIKNAIGLIENPYERTLLKRELDVEHREKDIEIIKKRRVVDVRDCFFCLGSAKLDSYMVVSVGENSYVSISRGPLTIPKKIFDVNGHVLLIPISHIKYLNAKLRYNLAYNDEKSQRVLGEDDTVQIKLILELKKYQNSLASLYKSFNFGTCIFEINSKNSIHYHQQCLPVKLYFSINRFMQTVKRMECRYSDNNYNNGNNSELSFRLYKEEDYEKIKKNIAEEYISIELRVINSDMLDNEAKLINTYYIISSIDSDKYVDLQFPRKALSMFLNLRDRMFWNKCVAEKSVEEHEAEKFRNFYEKFDFTLKQ